MGRQDSTSPVDCKMRRAPPGPTLLLVAVLSACITGFRSALDTRFDRWMLTLIELREAWMFVLLLAALLRGLGLKETMILLMFEVRPGEKNGEVFETGGLHHLQGP